jgi:hypothetical protein
MCHPERSAAESKDLRFARGANNAKTQGNKDVISVTEDVISTEATNSFIVRRAAERPLYLPFTGPSIGLAQRQRSLTNAPEQHRTARNSVLWNHREPKSVLPF